MIERRRPLPAGRYWVDVFASNEGLSAWFAAMGQLNRIDIEHTEHFDAIDGAEAHDFIIFRSVTDLVWPDDIVLVSPNVAPPSIRSSADTVDRPDPEKNPIDSIPSISAISSGLKAAGYAIGGLALAMLVISLASGRNRRSRR